MVQKNNKTNSAEEKVFELSKIPVQESEKKMNLIDVLKLVSPGTHLRTAIDDILRAEMGALIVIQSPKLFEIIEGGFRVNCRFTAQRLVELAKMDGAIILSENLKKILYVNTLLVPDSKIISNETGIRHKAAERTAKQADTIVIAVSERRKKITLYFGKTKYVLRSSSELLSRATESLQILEKHRDIYDELISNLNVLEVTNLISVFDVCSIIQRIEIILKISEIIKRNIIELGKEGLIVNTRLRELLKNIEKEEKLIFKDYTKSKFSRIRQMLNQFSFEDLLDIENISNVLVGIPIENKITPKGYRLLSRTSLDERTRDSIINYFKSLDKLFESDSGELAKVIKNESLLENFIKQLKSLKEQIIMGKKI